MVITDKHESIADSLRVKAELDELFSPLKDGRPENVRPYLIASDPDFVGADAGGWYPRKEFVELRDCVDLLSAQIKSFSGKERYASTVRFMLLSYSQIIEADYPYALVYNALRFSLREEPVWKFSNLASEEDQNKKGKEKEKLQQPSGKLARIKILADRVGSVRLGQFEMLLKSKLRNAVAHSHFYVDQNGTVFLTGEYSPISRIKNPEELKGTTCITYTREAIDRIYRSAYAYWECTNKLYCRFKG